jgi:YD repeat protein
VDPLAEKYPSVGAYVYCVGNPIKYIDPNGTKIDPGSQEE